MSEKDCTKKYQYRLNGTIYFICLTDDEKRQFENRYEVFLTPCN